MIYYICANDVNMGDYISMLGVKVCVGIEGESKFIEIEKSKLLQFIDSLKKDDYLIIGGGGLLKDYFENFWKLLLQYKIKNDFKYFIFGVGVCNHKAAKTILKDEIIVKIIQNSEYSFLRPFIPDVLSKHEKVKTICCPSIEYILQYKESHIKENIDDKFFLYVEHPGLVRGEDKNKILSGLDRLSQRTGIKIKTINHMPLEQDTLFKNYINAIGVISTRLHGYLFATFFQTPCVAISADYKIEGFSELFQANNVIDITNIDKINWESLPFGTISHEELSKHKDGVLSSGNFIANEIHELQRK